MTYQRRARATQPCGNPSRGCLKVYRLSHRHGRIKNGSIKLKIERISDKTAEEDEMTYQICANIVQPPANISKCHLDVYRPICQHGRVKSQPRNVKRMERSRRTYLKRINVLQSIWRPTKDKRRLEGLTFKSRMPGEPWRDVGDHG